MRHVALLPSQLLQSTSHQLFGRELVQVMPSGEGREDVKLANEPHLGAVIIDDGSAGNMSG